MPDMMPGQEIVAAPRRFLPRESFAKNVPAPSPQSSAARVTRSPYWTCSESPDCRRRFGSLRFLAKMVIWQRIRCQIATVPTLASCAGTPGAGNGLDPPDGAIRPRRNCYDKAHAENPIDQCQVCRIPQTTASSTVDASPRNPARLGRLLIPSPNTVRRPMLWSSTGLHCLPIRTRLQAPNRRLTGKNLQKTWRFRPGATPSELSPCLFPAGRPSIWETWIDRRVRGANRGKWPVAHGAKALGTLSPVLGRFA